MSSKAANIDELNEAVELLSEDAEELHALIEKSTHELQNATSAGNKATENASKIIEALVPLTELLASQHRDSVAMLDEAKRASDEQHKTNAEQMESLKGAIEESLESVRKTTQATCADLKKSGEDFLGDAGKASEEQRATNTEQMESIKGSVEEALATVSKTTDSASANLVKATEESFAALGKTQGEAFEEIQAKTLKEHERTRDELQTDMLGFKNATSSRMDSLENELTKVQGSLEVVKDMVAESSNSVPNKLLIPVYIAVGLSVLNLILLFVLLTR